MMPKIHRLNRRFFVVLISLSLAVCLPHPALGAAKGPTLCQISDTVYRADGSPARGTVLISWQAFTTSAGQAVSPGSLLVTLDSSGGFNASLAPNTGAQPAGTYYKAIFKLNDGTTETEYWVVPNTQTTTIGAIRSKLVPAQQAAQFLTRDVADSVYVSLASTQTITGVKTFSASPAVPTPQNPTDAANKSYVDANSGSAILASPPPIGNVTPNTVAATALTTTQFPVIDVRAYGAVGDGINVQNLPGGGTCSYTAGNSAVTCVNTIFAAGDVGKTLWAPVVGTVGGNNYLVATITAVASATQITVSPAPSHTQAGDGTFYGTDNATAFCTIANCTSATVPNRFQLGVNAGREIYLPGGSYFTSHPFYLRSGYMLRGAGQTGTQITLFSPVNQEVICESGNASGGTDTCTVDLYANGATQTTEVNGVLLRDSTEDASTVGILVPSGSGEGAFYISRVWTLTSGGGIVVNQGGGHITNVTCDFATGGDCILLNGGGPGGNQASTQINDVAAYGPPQSCLHLDGVTLVTVTNFHCYYPQAYGFYIHSGNGYTSNLVTIADSQVQVATGAPTNVLPYQFDSACVGCKLINSTATGATVESLQLNHSGITNFQAVGNTFQNDGLNGYSSAYINAAGNNILFAENKFINSGGYAVYAGAGNIKFINNTCTNPFVKAAPLSGNPYQQGCFYFTGGSSFATVEARGNSTDSNSYPVVSVYSSAIIDSSDNRAPSYSGCAVCTNNNGTAVYGSTINERAQNYGSSGNAVWSTNPGSFSALTYQNITGVNYLVSHYASIQAAINAAYNSGAVLGTVIDDRTAPYSGPGFILYDSITLRLAATTYTITSTVTNNNGHNNVTAGIILVPGAHLLGAGTSSNHGTILQPGNGLNADFIASSTVGTGTGASVQWWHWGEVGNLRIIGNGANQTSGDCLKIENMGETAKLHDVELSACYSNNVEIIGASATQSAISNVTSNLSVGGAGVAFTNLAGVGVMGGVSGDCNHTALIAANFGASGTLQINGLKAEAESSICPSQVQDPVILSTTTDSTVLASIKVDGGYAFGSTQHDFVKSTGPGSIQYLANNFYLTGYTNILNDTVRSQVLPNLSTTIKQPVSYLSNGTIFGNQAFWFQPNTFIQGNPNGTPTELFGLTSSGGALLAAPGNGDNANPGTGGIQISSFNRSIFGQTPEPMARWGWRFLGSGGGYDTTKWDLVPVWAAGDTSDRSIGNSSTSCQNGSGSVSCRWPHVYALNVDTNTFTLNGNSLATVATSGNYNDLSNKPTIPAQGVHVVSGTMQGPTAQITGTGSQIALYSATIPAGTLAAGTGLKCRAFFHHSTGSANVTMQWKLGSTTWNYPNTFSTGNSPGCQAEIEILTPSALNAETVNVPIAAWGGNYQAPYTGLAWSENLANASTITLNFSVANTDKLTGDTFYCETMQ